MNENKSIEKCTTIVCKHVYDNREGGGKSVILKPLHVYVGHHKTNGLAFEIIYVTILTS